MDRELVRSAMAGDRQAFDALASASIGRLYAVAALILRDPDRAADATQEALVTAWRDLSAIRGSRRFKAWLHRVLVRCCYREAGRERRRRLVEIHAVVDERGGPDALPGLIDRDQLDRAFRRLDIEERMVIVLHHIEGFLLTEMRGCPRDPARYRQVPPASRQADDARGARRGRPCRSHRARSDGMSTASDFDRTLETWLADVRPTSPPAGLFGDARPRGRHAAPPGLADLGSMDLGGRRSAGRGGRPLPSWWRGPSCCSSSRSWRR